MGRKTFYDKFFFVLFAIIIELKAYSFSLAGPRGALSLDFHGVKELLEKIPLQGIKQNLTTRNLLVLSGLLVLTLLTFLAFYIPKFLINLKMRQGGKKLATKDYNEAAKIFSAIIKEHPKHYQAHLKLASTHRANKELLKAIEVYKNAIKIKPDSSIELAKCIEIVRADMEAAAATKATSPQEVKAKRSVNYRKPTVKEESASRYIVQEEIGEGGMGTIYRALDSVLDRVVALKVLSKSLSRNERALKRFLREAQSAGKLHHPNIVNIYDIGKENNKLFIAMEYIEGDNLYDILQREGVFSTSKAINSIIQICEGLSEAHKNGIIHRDIKPENIMVDKFDTIKIMDFGVAHIENKGMTRTGAKIGTPLYMSPEQIRGEMVDVRSDIYSLGIMLYELLTGNPPFNEGDIAYMHLHENPKPPTTINPDISDVLNRICLKAIEKMSEDRYQTVIEFRDALKRICQAATEVDESPPDKEIVKEKTEQRQM